MIQIIVPMSGEARRFAERGYTFPKPLVEVAGRPVIELVVENITPNEPHRFVFVCRQEHLTRMSLGDVLSLIAPGSIAIGVDQPTAGALCSVLLASEHIESGELLICNADQVVDASIADFLQSARQGIWDGYIMTFPSTHPKWSYVKEENGEVIAVAEKRPISRAATVGIYYFRTGTLFLKAATETILKGASVGGEFFVSPVYNQMILAGQRVGHWPIPREAMHSLGTPEDLERFSALLDGRRGDSIDA